MTGRRRISCHPGLVPIRTCASEDPSKEKALQISRAFLSEMSLLSQPYRLISAIAARPEPLAKSGLYASTP